MDSQPLALIVRSPGTNCDLETSIAFQMAGAETECIHINSLVENPEQVDRFQIVCFPGGFSYGDDLSAGQILAFEVANRLFDRLRRFPQEGKLILGICNGFQVLMKTGLLVSPDDRGFPASLTWNTNGRYTDRWVHLVPGESRCVFLQGVKSLYLPIAHGEGRFVVRDEATLDSIVNGGQVALQYADDSENPNGSIANIAGLSDPTGHVFGLMPHPERHIQATQHPHWTREGLSEHPDGRLIFENAVRYFQNSTFPATSAVSVK
ncbi:MAG: phosphoribosylformylglycinamidine synthase I [Pirellulaceae bacterium]